MEKEKAKEKSSGRESGAVVGKVRGKKYKQRSRNIQGYMEP